MDSRARFHSRSLENVVGTAVVFLMLVTVFSWVLSMAAPSFLLMLLGDAAAGAVAYYLFLQWHKRPIRLRCDGCRNMIVSNTPWICGDCGKENVDTENFPFVNRCSGCNATPKSYICHHCGEPVFLSEDRDPKNPAERFVSDVPKTRQKAEVAAQRASVREEKEYDLEMANYDLVAAELNERLEANKKRAAFEAKSELEKKQHSLNAFMDLTLGIEEAARQQKAKHAESFKNDPKERKRHAMAVDEWVRREKAKGQ